MIAQVVSLLPETLDPVQAQSDMLRASAGLGAVASFTGVVRANAKGETVDYLYLDWYPGMSEASLQAIADAAAARFDISGLMILHRCGQVMAGAPVVFVAAASAHRRDAFEAVDYMMDRLKSEAALWKREVGPGLDHWVEPTAADGDDLRRWHTPGDDK